MGKIIHGNRNFGYAEINVVGETATFGVPVMLPGIKSTSIEVEQSNKKVYADDIVFAILTGAKVRNAEVSVLHIPSTYAKLALGMAEQANGMMVDTGSMKPHCIFFETTEQDTITGTEARTLHYLYEVVAKEPSKESATDEDEPDAIELKIPFEAKESIIAKDSNNKPVQYGYIVRTTENASLYDTFKQSVILPTDVVGA